MSAAGVAKFPRMPVDSGELGRVRLDRDQPGVIRGLSGGPSGVVPARVVNSHVRVEGKLGKVVPFIS